MRKISSFLLAFLLFVLGTYGERIFKFVYTLIPRIPLEAFTTFGVIASAVVLIILSIKK